MNASLQYAEVQHGINNGSPSGIMNGVDLPDILDAIRLIQRSAVWTNSDHHGAQNWFFKSCDQWNDTKGCSHNQ